MRDRLPARLPLYWTTTESHAASGYLLLWPIAVSLVAYGVVAARRTTPCHPFRRVGWSWPVILVATAALGVATYVSITRWPDNPEIVVGETIANTLLAALAILTTNSALTPAHRTAGLGRVSQMMGGV